MNLNLDLKIANNYKNNSQVARIITEDWVLNQVFCPNCGGRIDGYENNKPVADFYCKKCIEDFELKSKKGKIGKTISAGAYSKMIERINSAQKPHFFFMGYLDSFTVDNFLVVPNYFFVPEIIEKRKALAEKAKRAGWVGSTILFSKIPDSGKIYYVTNGVEIPKKEVLIKWQKTAFLKNINKVESKGWLLDIINCIESLKVKNFLLADIYNFEKDLLILHPENKNIRPKIRQQLQILRDKGYLKFLNKGNYQLL